jgi:hypothetical protein
LSAVAFEIDFFFDFFPDFFFVFLAIRITRTVRH